MRGARYILGEVFAGGRYFNAGGVASARAQTELDIDFKCSIGAGPAHNYLQLSRSIAVTRAFLKSILSRVVRKISWRMAPAFREACVSCCSIGAQSVRSLQAQAIYDLLAVFSCCLPWLGYGEMLFQRMLV